MTSERILGSDVGTPVDLGPTAAWLREAARDLVSEALRLDADLDVATLAGASNDLAQAIAWVEVTTQAIKRCVEQIPNLNAARWACAARVELSSAAAHLKDVSLSIAEGEQL